MKRLTALILTLMSIITIATPAFANDIAATNSDVIVTEGITETAEQMVSEEDSSIENDPDAIKEEYDGLETEEDGLIFNRDKNKPVAKMYLCVGGIHLPYFFGHSWICIENISEEPIKVDTETIEPGETVSTGLRSGMFGGKRGRNWNCEMSDYKNCKVSAIVREITAEQLKKAENEIENSDWSWYEIFAHNCTNYATSVWAAVTGKRYAAFCFPFVIRTQFPASEVVQISI